MLTAIRGFSLRTSFLSACQSWSRHCFFVGILERGLEMTKHSLAVKKKKRIWEYCQLIKILRVKIFFVYRQYAGYDYSQQGRFVPPDMMQPQQTYTGQIYQPTQAYPPTAPQQFYGDSFEEEPPLLEGRMEWFIQAV